MQLDDDYPEIFQILVWVSEKRLRPLIGAAAGDLAFEIAEHVRASLGGTAYRLQTWKPEHGDLFPDADIPRPTTAPVVRFTGASNNVDLIGFVRDTAAWLIACGFKKIEAAAIYRTADAIAADFHAEANGRDQTYIPKGEAFTKLARYRKIWEAFTGSNYAALAIANSLTEMRIRQIINAYRKAEQARRQSTLF